MNVPGRQVISNCGILTKKVSEFLDFHLKPVMQSSKSYIKDKRDLKIKYNQYIPNVAILDIADVVGLCPSITHDSGLKALLNILGK